LRNDRLDQLASDADLKFMFDNISAKYENRFDDLVFDYIKQIINN